MRERERNNLGKGVRAREQDSDSDRDSEVTECVCESVREWLSDEKGKVGWHRAALGH